MATVSFTAYDFSFILFYFSFHFANFQYIGIILMLWGFICLHYVVILLKFFSSQLGRPSFYRQHVVQKSVSPPSCLNAADLHECQQYAVLKFDSSASLLDKWSLEDVLLHIAVSLCIVHSERIKTLFHISMCNIWELNIIFYDNNYY